MYGRTVIDDFGPKRLKAVREQIVILVFDSMISYLSPLQGVTAMQFGLGTMRRSA
jgi:hypothetical protein